jgi:hypothetical protein
MKKSIIYSIPLYSILFWMLAILAIVLAIYFVFTVYNEKLMSGLNSDETKENYSNQGDDDSTEGTEGTDPRIRFMTYKDTANFLAKDNDGYVRNLTELDLHARNVKTHIDYLNNIDDTTISFTEDEKKLLVKCANNADKYLRDEKFAELKYGKHLDGKEIAGIKWVFANTFANYSKDVLKEYEQGLPHTRENIILLSKNVLKYNELDLTSTLIHEKIHIYQRYNPELFDKIIKEMGLKELDKKSFRHAKYIRSNPDTNNKLYYYPKDATTTTDTDTIKATATAAAASDLWNSMTGSGNTKDTSDTKDYDEDKVMVCLYRNDKPNSINDVKHKNFVEEHPYEKIAYEVAENYNNKNNNTKNKYINI